MARDTFLALGLANVEPAAGLEALEEPEQLSTLRPTTTAMLLGRCGVLRGAA